MSWLWDRDEVIGTLEESTFVLGGVGTGFFISRDGLALTAYHVIADCRTQGEPPSLTARYCGRDVQFRFLPDLSCAELDIAVLELWEGQKIEPKWLPVGRAPASLDPVGRARLWSHRPVAMFGYPVNSHDRQRGGRPDHPVGSVSRGLEGYMHVHPFAEVVEDETGRRTQRLRIFTDEALQLEGISGAPVYDTLGKCVTGVQGSYSSPIQPGSGWQSTWQYVYCTEIGILLDRRPELNERLRVLPLKYDTDPPPPPPVEEDGLATQDGALQFVDLRNSNAAGFVRRTIRKAISAATFTPVLGAECSEIRRPTSAAFDRIGEEMAALLREPMLRRSVERRYLHSLASAKGVTIPDYRAQAAAGARRAERNEGERQQRRRSRSTPDDEPQKQSAARMRPRELTDLRVALVKLAAETGTRFARVMENRARAVVDSGQYSIELAIGDTFDDTCESLLTACVRAHRLWRTEPSYSAFNAWGVWDSLRELAQQIIGDESDLSADVRERVARLQGAEEALAELDLDGVEPAPGRKPGTLFLGELEWLARMLWYTFRFDSEAYPSNDDLAFALSLGAGLPGAKAPLASVAQRRSDILPSEVSRWFAHTLPMSDPDSSGAVDEFYEMIAQILINQYEPPDPMMPVALMTTPPSVAFSVNYGMDLERALGRVLAPASARSASAVQQYVQVAFPVRATFVEDSSEIHHSETRWVLVTYAPPDVINAVEWAWIPNVASAPAPALKGPLVVKLLGSPLHRLPSARLPDGIQADDSVRGRTFLQIEHSITLSEANHLHGLMVPPGLPPALSDLMGDGRRSLYFMGLNASDWVIRLYFYDFWRRRRRGNRQDSGPSGVAINEAFDPYAAPLLDALSIAQWQGSMQRFLHIVQPLLPGARRE